MNYFIATNGNQFGPYPESKISEMVAVGRLKRTDLCWTEGMRDWAPIESVILLSSVLPPPIPIASSSRLDSANEPWFFYISIPRLIFMSLITIGLFEAYWIYKNWWYLKKRDGLNIMPFWRGFFGILFIRDILKQIKNDRCLNSLSRAKYSPSVLAAGWIFLMFFGNIFSRMDNIGAAIVGIVVSAPTVLFLLPAQNYINKVNAMRSPMPRYNPWSEGQFVVLAVGIIMAGMILV